MGTTSSKPVDNYKTMSAEEFEDLRLDPTNGYVLSECLVSTEIIAYVLSFVPKKELISNCRLVCRNWTQLVDDQVIWRNICDRLNIPVPRLHDQLPQHFYRALAFSNPYGRNLIRNPSGADGTMLGWQIESGGGEGWKCENPPNGSDELDTIEELKVAGIKGCFATSYGECRKTQNIDLIREGCHEDVLDKLRPKIKVSEWYAARFDCACRYLLHVRLLNTRYEVLDEFIYGPVDEPQWTGKAWHKAEHVFENYGPDLRFITFTHMGHDLQFWAGHFGSKMTAATVRFMLDNDKSAPREVAGRETPLPHTVPPRNVFVNPTPIVDVPRRRVVPPNPVRCVLPRECLNPHRENSE